MDKNNNKLKELTPEEQEHVSGGFTNPLLGGHGASLIRVEVGTKTNTNRPMYDYIYESKDLYEKINIGYKENIFSSDEYYDLATGEKIEKDKAKSMLTEHLKNKFGEKYGSEKVKTIYN